MSERVCESVLTTRLHLIAETTEINEFILLPEYIKIRREDDQSIPEATEDFCCKLVETLADSQTSDSDKKFLMAHLGLRDLWVDQERKKVLFQPIARGYPLFIAGAREGELAVGFDDILYAAGRLILDFARDPYSINTVNYYGCKVGQISKGRRLGVSSLPNLLGVILPAGVVDLTIYTV